MVAADRTSRCWRRSASASRSPDATLEWTLSDEARIGDHRWWISDLDAFRSDYPEWDLTFGIEDVLRDIYERNVDWWARLPVG